MGMTLGQVRDTLQQTANYHRSQLDSSFIGNRSNRLWWHNQRLVDSIDAHLAQHATMVEKLRELSRQMAHCNSGDMPWDFCDGLNEILSTEPADPVKVDVAATHGDWNE